MCKASLAGHDLDDVPLTGLACGGEFACIAEANGITIDVGDDVNDDTNDDARCDTDDDVDDDMDNDVDDDVSDDQMWSDVGKRHG